MLRTIIECQFRVILFPSYHHSHVTLACLLAYEFNRNKFLRQRNNKLTLFFTPCASWKSISSNSNIQKENPNLLKL